MTTKTERIFKIRVYEKERKFFWIYFVCSYFLIMALLVILLVLNYPLDDPLDDTEDFEYSLNLSIDFDDLDEEEIKKAKGWVDELKPEYASLIKTLKFTKNQSELDGSSDLTIGINRGGNITILYTGKERDREVLGHEILHDIISLPGEQEEWFVDDIELCMSAFKDGVFK